MINTENYGRAIIHNHTIYSDGLTTIEEFFASCQALNIDVAVIMDHDTTKGAKKALEYAEIHKIRRPQIIAGVEVSYALWPPFSHIGFIFPPNTPIIDIIPYKGLETAIAEARRKNPKTIVTLTHPAINITARRNPERFLRLVDVVETNCKVNCPEFANAKKKASGADTHIRYPNDPSWNLITLFLGRTDEDLIQALIDGTTIPITDTEILYPPTLGMRIEQYNKALIKRLPTVAKDIFRSFRR